MEWNLRFRLLTVRRLVCSTFQLFSGFLDMASDDNVVRCVDSQIEKNDLQQNGDCCELACSPPRLRHKGHVSLVRLHLLVSHGHVSL
jgi:hypothetical protein